MAKVASAETPAEVTLLKEEGSMMAYCGAVTTITFFTGPAPVEALRERLALVVAANPWLGGRLVRGKGEKRMRLVFDPAGPLRDGLFSVASPGQYTLQGVSYADIQKVVKGSQSRSRAVASSADTYTLCCAYGLQAQPSCMKLAPKAQGSLPRERAQLYARLSVPAPAVPYDHVP